MKQSYPQYLAAQLLIRLFVVLQLIFSFNFAVGNTSDFSENRVKLSEEETMRLLFEIRTTEWGDSFLVTKVDNKLIRIGKVHLFKKGQEFFHWGFQNKIEKKLTGSRLTESTMASLMKYDGRQGGGFYVSPNPFSYNTMGPYLFIVTLTEDLPVVEINRVWSALPQVALPLSRRLIDREYLKLGIWGSVGNGCRVSQYWDNLCPIAIKNASVLQSIRYATSTDLIKMIQSNLWGLRKNESQLLSWFISWGNIAQVDSTVIGDYLDRYPTLKNILNDLPISLEKEKIIYRTLLHCAFNRKNQFTLRLGNYLTNEIQRVLFLISRLKYTLYDGEGLEYFAEDLQEYPRLLKTYNLWKPILAEVSKALEADLSIYELKNATLSKEDSTRAQSIISEYERFSRSFEWD